MRRAAAAQENDVGIDKDLAKLGFTDEEILTCASIASAHSTHFSKPNHEPSTRSHSPVRAELQRGAALLVETRLDQLRRAGGTDRDHAQGNHRAAALDE